MTRITIVNAPSRAGVYQTLANDLAAVEPPVWALLTAEYLRARGHEITVIDAEAEGLNAEQTAQRILRGRNPQLVVFAIYGQQPSASTQCMPGAIATLKFLRFMSYVPTVAMGTHPSALPERTILDGFDFVVKGEGPREIDMIARNLGNGISPRIVSAPLIEDLSAELPRQAWDMVDMSRYRAHNWHVFGREDTRNSYASLQTSLGCPFRCEFCCINAPFGSAGLRCWSVENVIAQLDELVGKYDIKNIKIPDEMFVLNPRRVAELCERIIERFYAVNFWAYARVDTLKDERMLDLLKRAGFNWLGVGIESGSKHVRDGVEKGRFGNEDIIRTVERVKAHGIHIAANYIFGLPDDTHESMHETLALARELNTPWANFYSAMAYPGSPLHATARQNGWKLPEDGPGWIGYAQHAYDCLPLPTETLTAEQVLDFRDRAFVEYFSDPSYRMMIQRTFGQRTDAEIEAMLSHTVRRKHREAA